MYLIEFTKQADKTLRKMSRNTAHLIRKKLDPISKNPYGQHLNARKLRGRSGYRLRVGDWRIVYEIEDEKLVILVLKIASRGSIYR